VIRYSPISMRSIVTGVVLANASIDISLHDTYYIINQNNYFAVQEILPCINYYYKNFMINNYNNFRYYHPFFVGLLEGDGTITVDKTSNVTLRVRIVISLKNTKENYNMLNILITYIGGRLIIERNNRYVTWIASNKTDLAKVFAILAEYPLLTSKKICQLNYANKCLLLNNNKDILNNWQELKINKYITQHNLIENFNNKFILPIYYSAWLSGFIEAKGHFKLYKYPNGNIKTSQFIIGQNFENYILKSILKYFNKENCKIAEIKTKVNNINYYKIGIGGKDFRLSLKNNYELYHLLGNKHTQYIEWININ